MLSALLNKPFPMPVRGLPISPDHLVLIHSVILLSGENMLADMTFKSGGVMQSSDNALLVQGQSEIETW